MKIWVEKFEEKSKNCSENKKKKIPTKPEKNSNSRCRKIPQKRDIPLQDPRKTPSRVKKGEGGLSRKKNEKGIEMKKKLEFFRKFLTPKRGTASSGPPQDNLGKMYELTNPNIFAVSRLGPENSSQWESKTETGPPNRNEDWTGARV